MLGTAYRYRWLLYELVVRDLVLRYRGSVLGFVWTLLNPLLFMAIYTLVFSVYLRINMLHYAVFLISGLLPWLWFASATQAGTTSVVDGRVFIGKTTFAPIIVVLVPILSNLVNLVLSLPVLLLILVVNHMSIGYPVLFLPGLIVTQLILTFAILLVFSTFNVFYRDLQQLVAVFLTLMFYIVPIFYPLTSVPAAYRPYALLNPLAPLIMSYQDIFYWNRVPSWSQILYPLLAALALVYIGYIIFERYKDAFPDYV